jgi:hypothetical protein
MSTRRSEFDKAKAALAEPEPDLAANLEYIFMLAGCGQNGLTVRLNGTDKTMKMTKDMSK